MGRFATKRADSTPESPKYDVVLWGTVSREPKLTFTKEKEIPKVQFGVSYAPKTYMNCVTLKDTPTTRVAADLRVGTPVLCVGTWSSRAYTTKNGETKTWEEMLCDIIIPQPDVFYGQAEGNDDEEGTNGFAGDTSTYEEPDYELTI